MVHPLDPLQDHLFHVRHAVQFHHQVRLPFVDAEVEDGNDAGVVQIVPHGVVVSQKTLSASRSTRLFAELFDRIPLPCVESWMASQISVAWPVLTRFNSR